MSREWGCTLARDLERIEGDTASGVVLEDLTVVRSHDDGCTTLLGEAVQELSDSQAILCIEVPRRLVGEDELGTMRARAMATRCCSPPESSWGYL